MSIVVVGANHRTAPLELLERMSVRGDSLPKLLHQLRTGEHTSEAVVLATCNRTEAYLVAERFHGAFGEVRNFFSDLTYLPPDRFADNLYVHYDEQAVTHLFEVAAGLDSAVPGEHEILGQVRTAWEVARSERSAGRGLNLLFRHAIEVGKRARSETRIGEHTTSVSQAAVRMAAERLGSLAGRKVVVVGAGTMGRRLARFLDDAAVAELVIANRTVERAEELASEHQVDTRAVALSDLSGELGDADVLFCATEATYPVIGGCPVVSGETVVPREPVVSGETVVPREPVVSEEPVVSGEAVVPREPVVSGDAFARAVAVRDVPLLAIDLAVPRDIDPALGALDSVDLLDMSTVAEITEGALAQRRAEVAGVRLIVDDEVRRYMSASSAREVAPLIAAIHGHGEQIRAAEMRRFANTIDGLDDAQREMLEALTKGIVAKMLHEPSVRLKDSAGSSQGDRLAASIAELFDL